MNINHRTGGGGHLPKHLLNMSLGEDWGEGEELQAICSHGLALLPAQGWGLPPEGSPALPSLAACFDFGLCHSTRFGGGAEIDTEKGQRGGERHIQKQPNKGEGS